MKRINNTVVESNNKNLCIENENDKYNGKPVIYHVSPKMISFEKPISSKYSINDIVRIQNENFPFGSSYKLVKSIHKINNQFHYELVNLIQEGYLSE